MHNIETRRRRNKAPGKSRYRAGSRRIVPNGDSPQFILSAFLSARSESSYFYEKLLLLVVTASRIPRWRPWLPGWASSHLFGRIRLSWVDRNPPSSFEDLEKAPPCRSAVGMLRRVFWQFHGFTSSRTPIGCSAGSLAHIRRSGRGRESLRCNLLYPKRSEGSHASRRGGPEMRSREPVRHARRYEDKRTVWTGWRSIVSFCPNPVESSVEYSARTGLRRPKPKTSTGKLSKSTVCIRLSPGYHRCRCEAKQGGAYSFILW